MSPDKVLVLASAFALISWIALFFGFGKKLDTRAALTSSGYQEVMVLVKGGYTPNLILVEA